MSKDRARPVPARSPAGEAAHDGLEAFCLFVGPNRSGSSLVGSMLDAHPQAVIAHELDMFARRGRSGELAFADREQAFAAIAAKSARSARKGRPGRRRGGDVSYEVAGQFQGRGRDVRVIGTKRAYRTMTALALNPRGLDELAALVALPMRLVHCVRNPFDNVASMTKQDGRELRARHYVELTELMGEIRAAGWEPHDVHLEDLVADPRGELGRVCEFLELEADTAYLDACAELVSDSPSESRHGRDWRPADVRALEQLIERTPWLARYAGTEIRP